MKNEKNNKVVEVVMDYKHMYDTYASPYQKQARKVYNLIHGKIDWSHKEDHHAKIHLNKLGLAQDNWKASVKKGLMNFDDWMEVSPQDLMTSDFMTSFEAKRMVELMFRDENVKVKVSDCLGLAFVENLATLKVNTVIKDVRGPNGKRYKSPRTELIPLDIWDIATDPEAVDGNGLFFMHQGYVPKYQLIKNAAKEPSIEKPYILEVVKNLEGAMLNDREDEQKEAQGNQVNAPRLSRKKYINILEVYGTILDDDGMIMEYTNSKGETFPLENVMITIANGEHLISEPKPLDQVFINGEDPFVSHKLLRSNKDILGRAIAHAGYEINKILDAYTSAMADAGIKASSNIILYKPDALLDQDEGVNGFTYDSNVAIMPGHSLKDVFSTARLGELPQTMFNVHRILTENFAENVSKNGTALSGMASNGATSATEAAQASNTVASLDESLLMDVDDVFIEKLILKVFHQGLGLAKFFNDLDLDFIFADGEEGKARKEKFKKLRKNKKKLFEELGYTFRFRGRGLRGITNQARVGQMTMNLLTSVLGNPTLIEILERNNWDLSKMLSTGVKGMGIDPETLKDDKVGEMARERQNFRELGRGVADGSQGSNTGQGQQQGAVPATQRVTGDTEPGNNGA